MALVLQFLSTKIFQRTLSSFAQENQLRQSVGVVPVLRVQRYDFSANLQRNRKDFLRKTRKKRGKETIIIGRGVDIPYYIVYIGDGDELTLPLI